MKDQHDAFWNAVVAAETPSAEEMALAEAGLREIEAAEPAPEALSAAQIDAMIAAAVSPVVVGDAPRRPGMRRLIAIAAVLFLSLSVAAVWMLWSEGTHPRRTLDYAEAIIVATESKRVEEHKLSALFIIDLNCSYAFPKLRSLCAEHIDPSLRDPARRICNQLVMLLTHGADRAPEAADLGLVQATETALNASLAIEQRQQALAHLGHLCMQGMRAFAICELGTTEGNEKRRYWRDRFLRYLTE